MAQKCKGLDITYPNPIQYPNAARAARVQGEVVLQIHIAAGVDTVSGPPMLAESAKRFVESWSITPPPDTSSTGAPPSACEQILRVTYKLKQDRFNLKLHLPSHILVEAPPIEAK